VKKWLAILLVAVYAVIISGVEISIHYCCGKLENISIWSDAGKACDSHENDGKCCVGKTCCKTTQFTTGQRIPHTASDFSIATPVLFAIPFAVITHSFEENIPPNKTTFCALGHDPPIKRPLFLLYSSLVFYASC
jgi:hypothetical protein